MSDDDVGGDDGNAGGRGGGGGDARRSGVAAVRDDDVDGDWRDDNESVSRGGTPAPLSARGGATPGGGAAGSEASETSERAGASGYWLGSGHRAPHRPHTATHCELPTSA